LDFHGGEKHAGDVLQQPKLMLIDSAVVEIEPNRNYQEMQRLVMEEAIMKPMYFTMNVYVIYNNVKVSFHYQMKYSHERARVE
jgi:ABC-type oligopeptide transport system substrate-binding subunit